MSLAQSVCKTVLLAALIGSGRSGYLTAQELPRNAGTASVLADLGRMLQVRMGPADSLAVSRCTEMEFFDCPPQSDSEVTPNECLPIAGTISWSEASAALHKTAAGSGPKYRTLLIVTRQPLLSAGIGECVMYVEQWVGERSVTESYGSGWRLSWRLGALDAKAVNAERLWTE